MLVKAAKEVERLANTELVGELRVLELNTESLAEVAGVVFPCPAEHLDVTCVAPQKAFTYLYSGGLARSIWAEEAEAFAVADLKIESINRDNIAIGLPESADNEGVCRCHHRETRAVMKFGRKPVERCMKPE
jgi:hypothetical protein